jgi:hypothetical protein
VCFSQNSHQQWHSLPVHVDFGWRTELVLISIPFSVLWPKERPVIFQAYKEALILCDSLLLFKIFPDQHFNLSWQAYISEQQTPVVHCEASLTLLEKRLSFSTVM